MQTILLVLDSEKLENPDLDIRYNLPDKLENYTNNEISDNGYDYLTDTDLGIWLQTQSAKESYGKVVEFLEQHMVCGNDLSATAKVYISEKEAAALDECTLVYDGEAIFIDEEQRVNNQKLKTTKIILKIASLIVNDNTAVIKQLETELCELQDIDEQWECFTNTLKGFKYIYECDEDVELNGFLEFLKDVKSLKSNDITVEEKLFDEDTDLFEWCEVLDEKWENTGYCMAIYETESGNEVVFPSNRKKLEQITELANELGINVVAAAEY